MEILDLTFT